MDRSVWSVDINAPRERVWRALTAPGEIQRFYFDSRFEADLRPGGEYRYTTADGTRTFIRGEVLDVVPNVRFVHRFQFTDIQEAGQEVTFLFEDISGGTRVTVRHEGLQAAPKHRRRVTGGWTGILKNLKQYLEKGSLPLGARIQYAVMKALVPLMPKDKPAAR